MFSSGLLIIVYMCVLRVYNCKHFYSVCTLVNLTFTPTVLCTGCMYCQFDGAVASVLCLWSSVRAVESRAVG